MKYIVYILRCADDTLYTGITTDIERRLSEHNASRGKGAKYTRTRRPVVLIYQKEFPDRREATREELRIKKLSRVEKERLVLGVH